MDRVTYRTKEYMRDNFIRFLIDGKIEATVDEIETRKKCLGLEWLQGPFVVALAAPNYAGAKNNEKDIILCSYEEYVKKEVNRTKLDSYCITNSYNQVVILLALRGNECKKEELNKIFADIYKKLIKKFDYEVFIGVGSVANNYQEIATSASDAREMLAYKYQYADSGVVNIMNMVQFQFNTSGGNRIAFDRVIGCFQDGNLGKMEQRLNELVEFVRRKPNVSNTSIRRTLVELTVHILHVASNANVDVEVVLKNVDPYRWIMKQNHTEVITEWIMKMSSELLLLMQNRKENEERVVIQDAKQFIDENLSNIDLSLQQVSDAIGLSSTYCSQLFKSEVGLGINSYITQNRINRAQVLLRETQLMSSDIARQVGFVSASYFGQVFRKVVGMTPQEYRRSVAKIEKN